jgi:hypothetical protein
MEVKQISGGFGWLRANAAGIGRLPSIRRPVGYWFFPPDYPAEHPFLFYGS